MVPTARQLETFQHTLAADLAAFAPEMLLVGSLLVMLLSRLFTPAARFHLAPVAILGVGAAFALALQQLVAARVHAEAFAPVPRFGGMIVTDGLTLYGRAVVLAAAWLTVLLTALTGIPDVEDASDFYSLLLGGTLGMMLLTQSQHLLMVFLALEMASVPSYALAGFLKGRKTGSEAALKYVVFGAAASGTMLYGISLLAGNSGTGLLHVVAHDVVEQFRGGEPPLFTVAGLALLAVGLGFKLAAVPFHFWCPDVFEGAAAEVAGFLSVASKAAAMILTMRLLRLLPGVDALGLAVGIIAALTVTFGNLAAYGQTNLKRLLAYSTIAHAGTMLLGLAVMQAGANAAVLYYLAAYVVMNLGAFAVVALVRNSTGSEDLEAYRGLAHRSPGLAVLFTLCLLSLLGLPPLAGFAAKFQVFAALGANGSFGLTLLGVGALNTALSAYYYLKIVRVMVLEEPATPGTMRVSAWAMAYLGLLAAALFLLGLWWNPLMDFARWAAA